STCSTPFLPASVVSYRHERIMRDLILAISEDATRVGGKAAGLARARATGVRVPAGFVIAPAAYQEVVNAAGGPWPLSEGEDPVAQLERARAALAAAPLPAGLADALAAAVQQLLAAEDLGGASPASTAVLSVRSSAVGPDEDSAQWSAAGVFASQLGVEV